jgi:hypothetical protein
MDKPLTPTMKRCLKHMAASNGRLIRYAGGYWASQAWERWKAPWFGASTIEALINRGLAEYTRWKPSTRYPGGKFPIEVMLKAQE